jgi:hypothetical protein
MPAPLPDVQTTTITAPPLLRWTNPSAPPAHYYTTTSEQGGPLAGTWQFERSAGNVVTQPLMGTLPVYCYVNAATNDFYYNTTDAPPMPSGWTKVPQTPWYVFDPEEPPPPGAVALQCWTDGIHHFYTADPELETLADWAYTSTLGYIYKGPMAVYRWWSSTAGYHFYSTAPNAAGGEGLVAEGKKFYAFVTPIPGTLPLFSYRAPQDQYLDNVRELARPGWNCDSDPAFYVFPEDSDVADTVPLQHYEAATTNFYTANPAEELLGDYTYSHDVGQVYQVPANGQPPTITLSIVTGTLPGSEQRSLRDVRDVSYITCDAHWYGLRVSLSHQAASDVNNGLNIAAGITAAVAAGTSISGPAIPVVVGIVSGFLWAFGATVSLMDRGKGVLLYVPWTSIVSLSPTLVYRYLVIPYPR